MATRAIDYWANPFTTELRSKGNSHPEIQQLVKWWGMEERYNRCYTVEEVVALLDEANVEMALIPSFQMRSFQRQEMIRDVTPEGVKGLIAKSPARFGGLYGINPYKKMAGVKELENAVIRYGFKGAHLHTYGFGLPLNARDYWPYYAKCVELDIPVVMQIGHSAESMPSECGRPALLDDIALYFPELRIVGAHTGWPWLEEAIAMAWKHPNVYLGTTAHRPKYWEPALVSFINSRGRGKVLWGTDFPLLTYKESLLDIDKLNLRPEAKEQLLWGAATKVFKL